MRLILIAAAVISFLCSLLGCVMWMSTNDTGWVLVAIAHLSIPALLVLPIMTGRRISAVEPLNLFLLYIVIGTVFSSYALAFLDTDRVVFLMNGEPLAVFLFGAVMLVIAMFLVGLGYSVAAVSRIRLPAQTLLPREQTINRQGIYVVAVAGLIVSVLATLAFLDQTGGINSLADLSRKRTVEIDTRSSVLHGSASYLRLIAESSLLLLFIVLAYNLKNFKTINWKNKAFLLALFVAGCATPFFSSSRSSILFPMIGLLMTYMIYRRVSKSMLIYTAAAGLIMFGLMSGLRDVRGADPYETTSVFFNPIVSLAQSGNGMSLAGTSHILDGVPDRMNYKWGSTYLTWVFAPIPRAMWPAKPEISLGKEVKEVILDQQVIRTGRPPSIITEGYINYGLAGFLLSAFVFGFVMRLAANSFLPVMDKNIFAFAFYYSLCLNLSALANSAFSQCVVRILSDWVVLYLIYIAIRVFSQGGSRAPSYGSPPVTTRRQ